jgi:hypothetical protein
VNQRILELALEALTARKAAIEAEIAGLKSTVSPEPAAPSPVAAVRAPKKAHPKQSAAARKAQSRLMKAYWAKRKAEGTAPRGKKR